MIYYVNLHGFTPVVSSRLNSRVQAVLALYLIEIQGLLHPQAYAWGFAFAI